MLRGLDRLLPVGNDEILGLEVATVTSDTAPVTVHKLADPPGTDIQVLTWWVKPVLGQRVWLLATKSQRIIVGVHGGYDETLLYRTPDGLSDTGVSWDTLDTPGLHSYLMLATQPGGPGALGDNGYYYVQTFKHSDGTVTQLGIPHLGTQHLVWRSRYSGVWSAWNTTKPLENRIKITRSTDQTIASASTWYRLSFNVTDFTLGSGLTRTPGGGITVSGDGYYEINAAVPWDPIAGVPRRIIRLSTGATVGTGILLGSQVNLQSEDFLTISTRWDGYLAAGTTVYLEFRSSSTNSYPISDGTYTPYMSLRKIPS